jgi:hypothetical protein
MVTGPEERAHLFASARTKAAVDQLHAQFHAEDEAADHARRFPPPPPSADSSHSLAATIGAAVGKELRAVRDELTDRLERLEQRVAELDHERIMAEVAKREAELVQKNRNRR